MRRLAIFLAIIGCTVFPLIGVARASDYDECQNYDDSDFDREINACDRVINSGTFSGKELAPAYFFRGQAHNGKGQYALAIRDFDKAISLVPSEAKYAIAFVFRGAAYVDLGNYDRAINDFSKALALDKSNTLAYNNRAIAYEKKGD